MKKIKPRQEKFPKNKSNKLDDISSWERKRNFKSSDKRKNNPRNQNWV